MTLLAGSRVGAFEIRGVLGRGGMGEVYRGFDLRLGREVAIKILPEGVSSDPDRSARFQLEARVLASLNHPNVGAIYGVEESGDLRALVLELVEGPTLEDRVGQAGGSASKPRGLPLDETLSIAQQIAVALEAAHEQGIVHRDLKPANVKVRPDGTVKVLDFGLAKLTASGPIEMPAGATESPTLTSPSLFTQHGVILGTATYMSPEQARGKVADKRSDVWSFGCVLYEMLTGRRAFPGEDLTDTLAAVVRAEPDWSALPASTPPSLRRLLERALRKDPRQRLPDIGSARLEIADALIAASEPSSLDGGARSTATRSRSSLAVLIAATVAAAILGAVATWLLRPSRGAAPSQAMPLHVEITTPPTTDPVSFAISPDGRQLAFVASSDRRSRLWLRSLTTGEVRSLRDTDGATYPFWSPDGRSIGFAAQWSPDGQRLLYSLLGSDNAFAVMEKPVDGIGEGKPFRGPDSFRALVSDWSSSGWLLTGGVEQDVYAVPLDGGKTVAVAQTKFNEQPGKFSPDGRWVAYVSDESGGSDVFVQSFPDAERRLKISIDGGVQPRFRSDGDELFYLEPGGRLMAVTLRRRPAGMLEADTPVPLFTAPLSVMHEGGVFSEYDVTADGSRFLLNALIEQESPPLQLVLHRPVAATAAEAPAR